MKQVSASWGLLHFFIVVLMMSQLIADLVFKH